MERHPIVSNDSANSVQIHGSSRKRLQFPGSVNVTLQIFAGFTGQRQSYFRDWQGEIGKSRERARRGRPDRRVSR